MRKFNFHTMKAVQKYYKIILVAFLTLFVTSCEIEESSIESEIVGRSWTGDVGLNASNGEPIFSTFRFGADGFGTETQYYTRDGRFYQEYNYEWYWEPGYRNNLVLNYGRFGTSYMKDLQVYRGELSGYFYFAINDPSFFFQLKME